MDPTIAYLAHLAPQVGLPVAGVFLAFKVLMNGMREDIRTTRSTVEGLDAKLDAHSERLTRLEMLTSPPAVRPVLREISNGD